jgi:hypothetical protein
MTGERFDTFNVPELQQLLAAVAAGEATHVIAGGERNLLPELRAQIGAALERKIGQED